MRAQCQSVAVVGLLLLGLVCDALGATGSLLVKVIDEEDEPVEITMVQLWVKTAAGGGRGFEFAMQPTDTPGTFRVSGVPADRYEGLKIDKAGYAPGWTAEVQIEADRETSLSCMLPRGGTIEGWVADESGTPVEGIPVVVNSMLCRRDVVTDRKGRFVAEHLSNTKYSIVAEPKPDSLYAAAILSGGALCGAKDLRLVLKRKNASAGSAAGRDTNTPAPGGQNVSTNENELGVAATRSGRLAREGMIGKPAPAPIVERWYNGDFWRLNLSDKVVLLDFWGVWCSPCRRQIPQIRDLAAKYADKGLVVIGIHTQDKKQDLPSFLTQNSVPYLIGVDSDNKTAEAYRVTGYPTIALIDRKGVLRAVDPHDLEQEVVGLLGKVPEQTARP